MKILSPIELNIVTYTASITLAKIDGGKLILMNGATTNNITVPANASVNFPIGTQIVIIQKSAIQTTFIADVGVTINSANSILNILNRYGNAILVKTETNTWELSHEADLSNLNASNLTSGTVPTARLGTGTANSTTYLRGDNTWQTISSSNIYTSDGTLSGARVVTMAGNGLTFTGGQTTLKGSGTTSATTSLLVQNSAGTSSLSILDNGKFTLGQSVTSFDNTCVAIGNTITSSATKTVVIGSDGATASAFGAIRIGAYGSSSGQGAIAVGYNSIAGVAGVAIGESTSSSTAGVAIGYNCTTLNYSTAIQGISSATHNIMLGTSIYINQKINDIANTIQIGVNGAESGNNMLLTADGICSFNNNSQPVSGVSFPSSGTNINVNNLGVNPTSNVGAVQQYVNYNTIAVASSTAGATATGTGNTKVLTFSVGANMTALTVGKILRIAGGSGRPATFYRIVSVSGQNVTLDGYLKNVFSPSFDANTTSLTASVTIVSDLRTEFRNDLGTTVKLYQETTAVASATLVSNAGTTLTSTDTIDGYTLQQVVKALRNLGILA